MRHEREDILDDNSGLSIRDAEIAHLLFTFLANLKGV